MAAGKIISARFYLNSFVGKIILAGGEIILTGGEIILTGGKIILLGGKIIFAGGKMILAGLVTTRQSHPVRAHEFMNNGM